ncbi:DUF4044 domain-containing protein [Granulicatella sp. zg-ZJ]|nr:MULTISPECIES: DUF4044 domain-containing protein [unclassified Granulicatella]MBS4750545.1 DUF4044 domain-containing protein [Carnobacteriaceae bacterium zg-ZUI78]NEW63447.1 DUF4044 domain-containing protein [Granulicatella sp. zg-ZJ]NEW66722.1 DUF4044 domain-containing protein [Granulicatella sp. zg-84]QMI85300.1 DUF4044 domain-containing protein [Carnobacteriaceae bacterium zg-84]
MYKKKEKTKMEKITQIVVWLMLIATLGSIIIGSGMYVYNFLNH